MLMDRTNSPRSKFMFHDAALTGLPTISPQHPSAVAEGPACNVNRMTLRQCGGTPVCWRWRRRLAWGPGRGRAPRSPPSSKPWRCAAPVPGGDRSMLTSVAGDVVGVVLFGAYACQPARQNCLRAMLTASWGDRRNSSYRR